MQKSRFACQMWKHFPAQVEFWSVSPFIDKKVYQYTLGLFYGPFLTHKTEAIFDHLTALLGPDTIRQTFLPFAQKQLEGKRHDLEEIMEASEYDTLKKLLGRQTVAQIIMKEMPPALKARQSALHSRSCAINRKLAELRDTFKLSPVEVELIAYFHTLELVPMLAKIQSALDLDEKPNFFNLIGKIIGYPRTVVKKAIQSGNLVKCELLDCRHFPELSSWVHDYLSGLKKDLNSELYQKLEGPTIPLGNHLIPSNEMDVLKTMVKENRPRNILFYGEPGTGKTELARSLAQFSGRSLHLIHRKEDQDSRAMKQGLVAACNILDPRESLILVDEADALLNTDFSWLFSGEKNNKKWLNHFIDSCRHTIIWITNDSGQIHRSTMRRFDFSLRFKPFSPKKKLAVLQYHLKQKGLEGYFTPEEMRGLCHRYTISAGGIASALKNLRITKRSRKESILPKLETLLQAQQVALTGKKRNGSRLKELDNYCLEVLNTAPDVEQVVASVRSWFEAGAGASRNALNVLLYGPPGTGKTEFVKHLAQELDRDIVLKRASDLLDCYVGGTEKRIVEAFEEAEESEGILFLDEADSFLSPRAEAQRSWEKTQVNELLTQMENYRGVLICATNFLKGLDPAVLRRFVLKVEFKALSGAGILKLYDRLLHPLATRPLTDEEKSLLLSLNNLTPGDFYVVREQVLFTKTRLNPEELIQSLKLEVIFKPNFSKKAGF